MRRYRKLEANKVNRMLTHIVSFLFRKFVHLRSTKVDFDAPSEFRQGDFPYDYLCQPENLPDLPPVSVEPLSPTIRDEIVSLLFEDKPFEELISYCQGFSFRNLEHNQLCFGLRQDKMGPCGLIASVNAYYIKHKFFCLNSFMQSAQRQTRLAEARADQLVSRNCLVAALADILWKAMHGSRTLKIFRYLSKEPTFRFEDSEILTFDCDSRQKLYSVLLRQQSIFINSDGRGLAAFVYSIVLTRGLENVQQDQSQPA